MNGRLEGARAQLGDDRQTMQAKRTAEAMAEAAARHAKIQHRPLGAIERPDASDLGGPVAPHQTPS